MYSKKYVSLCTLKSTSMCLFAVKDVDVFLLQQVGVSLYSFKRESFCTLSRGSQFVLQQEGVDFYSIKRESVYTPARGI